MRHRGARHIRSWLVRWALATCICGAAAPRFASAASADATTVSLRLRDVPAKEAYEQLARKAKIGVRYISQGPADDARVTVNLIHEPLWSALEKVNARTGMDIASITRDPAPQLALKRADTKSPTYPIATTVSGAFYGTVYQMTLDEDPKLSADRTKSVATSVAINLRVEPKIYALLWHSIVVDDVTDEFGGAIAGKQGTRSMPFTGGAAGTVLNLPPRPWPRKIGRLRARGKVLAAVRSEIAEVAPLTDESPQQVNVAGFRLDTTTVAKPDKGRLITVTMTRTGSSGPEWLRSPQRAALLQPVVLDENGRRFSTLRSDFASFGKNCRFQLETMHHAKQDIGQPHKLILEIPTDVVEYDVQLEFTDMTLR